MANLSAMIEVHDFLEEHPDVHRQDTWACGTTGCVAGWAIALNLGLESGDNIQEAIVRHLAWNAAGDELIAEARKILGLTTYDADTLFLHVEGRKAAVKYLGLLIKREKSEELTSHEKDYLSREYWE